jgi:hypothetical protein
MTHKDVIEFITEHIIHRFGIPQTLTTDQGTSFMSKEVREFAELYRTKLLNSSPYYAQANGQAESSNRTLINLIKKKISGNPKHWHKILSEALWAHRISKHSATKVSPFELVYGQEAVLPVKISLNVLGTKLRCGQSSPEAGRSAPVGRTVRARAEQIRVPSFSLRLLAKIAGFARSFGGKGSSPLLYK